MFRIVALVTLALTPVILPSSSPVLAQQGTREEREACRPDVRRFCVRRGEAQNEPPLQCLQRNRSRLSRACRAVLERHGQ